MCVCEYLEDWVEKNYVSIEESQNQRPKKLDPQSNEAKKSEGIFSLYLVEPYSFEIHNNMW